MQQDAFLKLSIHSITSINPPRISHILKIWALPPPLRRGGDPFSPCNRLLALTKDIWAKGSLGGLKIFHSENGNYFYFLMQYTNKYVIEIVFIQVLANCLDPSRESPT